jgi:hypothetical protein
VVISMRESDFVKSESGLLPTFSVMFALMRKDTVFVMSISESLTVLVMSSLEEEDSIVRYVLSFVVDAYDVS